MRIDDRTARSLTLAFVLLHGLSAFMGFPLPTDAGAMPQSGVRTKENHALPASAASAAVQAIVAANRTFEESWSAVDRLAVDRMLEPEFTWTTSAGIRLTREEALAQWPKLVAFGHESEVTQRTYGHVAVVQIRNGKTFALRVWVSQPKNSWRLLHVAEIVQSPLPQWLQPPTPEEPIGVLPSETGVEADCMNPCLMIPYRAPTPNARAAMSAFQQMEIAAAARDMEAWSLHVAADAIIVDSAGEGQMSKAQRMTEAHEQKLAGARSNEAPPLVWARTFDVDGTIVMLSLQQPYKGQPFHATRVWVNRGSRYQMALSYHAIVRDAPSFTLLDQLDPP